MGYGLVCGLEHEYCISVILDDDSFVHDTGDWFFDSLEEAFHAAGGEESPLRTFGMVLGDDAPLTFWLASTAGKLYEDQVRSAIVEYATPECDNFENAVRAEKAGERILHVISRYLCERGLRYDDCAVKKILFSKNNSDNIRGVPNTHLHFRGSHENYQVPVDFETCGFFYENVTSFLPVRILFSGGGGLAYRKKSWRYFLSPRGTITGVVVGSSHDDHKRPMFDWKYWETLPEQRRLEVVSGDSNTHPRALRWRLGLMCAFLRFVESNRRCGVRVPIFANPIGAMRIFSSDATLRATAKLRNGRGKWTLVECAREWLEIFSLHAECLDDSERLVVAEARALAENSMGDPDAFSEETDWGLKLSLLNDYCAKKQILFADPRARRFDVYYSDISPDGIFNKWQAHEASKGEAQKKISRCFVPFSREDMDDLVWQNRAAPRAELRKRHLKALFEASLPAEGEDWGIFSLRDDDMIEIRDPMTASHDGVEADIKKLEEISAHPRRG